MTPSVRPSRRRQPATVAGLQGKQEEQRGVAWRLSYSCDWIIGLCCWIELPCRSVLAVEGLKLGTRREGLLGIIPTSGLAQDTDGEHLRRLRELAGEPLAALQAGGIGGGGGGVILKFARSVPRGILGGFDLDARLAGAGIKPAAVVKRLAVDKHDAAGCLGLVKRHRKPILGARLVVKGHHETVEVLINNRAVHIARAGTTLLAVEQDVPVGG